jgi:hypothetical protein
MLFEGGAATLPLTVEGITNLIPYPLSDLFRTLSFRVDQKISGGRIKKSSFFEQGLYAALRILIIQEGPRACVANSGQKSFRVGPQPDRHGSAPYRLYVSFAQYSASSACDYRM